MQNSIKLLGTSIDNSLTRAKEIAKKIREIKNPTGGREIALLITKLEEAEHWRKQAEENI